MRRPQRTKPSAAASLPRKLLSKEGLIFDLQRASTHDGPGLRTTVFCKGCPLQCLWCHNPESISPHPEVLYTAARCRGCGRCLAVCRSGAIGEDGPAHRRQHLCTACGACTEACAGGALYSAGRTVTVAEILDQALLDARFYAQSGGGVTISGGEPMLQPSFTAALAESLHRLGISAALDTSGLFSYAALEPILPFLDLILFDLKHMHWETHQRLTGVSNERILMNLEELANGDAEILIRIPVIPGCNDDDEHLYTAASFLASLPRKLTIELLPYHGLGAGKYRELGQDYSMMEQTAPDQESMDRAAAWFRQQDLPVRRARA